MPSSAGHTIDFLLPARRDATAATRFLQKAMKQNGEPEKVMMDKSGSNKAAMDGVNEGRYLPIEIRQIKYLNNIIEQDHRTRSSVSETRRRADDGVQILRCGQCSIGWH